MVEQFVNQFLAVIDPEDFLFFIFWFVERGTLVR